MKKAINLKKEFYPCSLHGLGYGPFKPKNRVRSSARVLLTFLCQKSSKKMNDL